jgi:hypothetical protein
LRDPGPPTSWSSTGNPAGESTRIHLTPSFVNEDEFARQEARAKRERETAAALAEIGIQSAEASLFHVVHFGITVTTSDLWRRAASPDYAVGGRLNPAAYEAALNDCLSKGWLQIIDDAILGTLQE